MQVLFVLRFYHLDKTNKIHRLIHDSGLVTNLMYVLKLFQVTAGNVHSFRIRSKETLRIMYPKYPVLDMIQRIHLRCGSFGSVIRDPFWILVKKRSICFRIWVSVKKRTIDVDVQGDDDDDHDDDDDDDDDDHDW